MSMDLIAIMQKFLNDLFTNRLLCCIIPSKAGDRVGEIRENVQRNLGYYLCLRGISQKELAQRLGVSPSAVTNWIKGKNSPDIEMVAEICGALEVSVSDLFGKKEEGANIGEIEKRVLEQYHKKPELHQAIHILLGINISDEG